MYGRFLEKKLTESAQKIPVITLMGPRQSGKTTLARQAFPEHSYVSLERPDERARALQDPISFLARFTKNKVILDEVQRAPELLSYIQGIVDDKPTPGQFILTGSHNLLLMQNVAQTLAGRTALYTLLPLSVAELFGRKAVIPEQLDLVTHDTRPPFDEDVWTLLWKGFYPRIHDLNLEPQAWLADYQRTYVERDLRDILRVMDLNTFERFVRLTAARTGQELNLNSLADDVGISQPTAKQWLNILQLGFIVTLLPPHHQNFRKRLRKRPKLHFLDTGLCAYLLGIHHAETLKQHPLRGALFESFVVAELCKAFANQGKLAPLYFWKDTTGHEIDILVDLGTKLIPIEVKPGKTVVPSAVNTLHFWAGLQGNTNTSGVLVYAGDKAYTLDQFAVLPWYLN